MLKIKRKAQEKIRKKVNNNDYNEFKRKSGFGSNTVSSM